jgi:EpsI family protein
VRISDSRPRGQTIEGSVLIASGSVFPTNTRPLVAIILQGDARMMVYDWFQQKDRCIAWAFSAKCWLMVDGIIKGSTDGALVQLTTAIRPDESNVSAEARLQETLEDINPALLRFITGGEV